MVVERPREVGLINALIFGDHTQFLEDAARRESFVSLVNLLFAPEQTAEEIYSAMVAAGYRTIFGSVNETGIELQEGIPHPLFDYKSVLKGNFETIQAGLQQATGNPGSNFANLIIDTAKSTLTRLVEASPFTAFVYSKQGTYEDTHVLKLLYLCDTALAIQGTMPSILINAFLMRAPNRVSDNQVDDFKIPAAHNFSNWIDTIMAGQSTSTMFMTMRLISSKVQGKCAGFAPTSPEPKPEPEPEPEQKPKPKPKPRGSKSEPALKSDGENIIEAVYTAFPLIAPKISDLAGEVTSDIPTIKHNPFWNSIRNIRAFVQVAYADEGVSLALQPYSDLFQKTYEYGQEIDLKIKGKDARLSKTYVTEILKNFKTPLKDIADAKTFALMYFALFMQAGFNTWCQHTRPKPDVCPDNSNKRKESGEAEETPPGKKYDFKKEPFGLDVDPNAPVANPAIAFLTRIIQHVNAYLASNGNLQDMVREPNLSNPEAREQDLMKLIKLTSREFKGMEADIIKKYPLSLLGQGNSNALLLQAGSGDTSNPSYKTYSLTNYAMSIKDTPEGKALIDQQYANIDMREQLTNQISILRRDNQELVRIRNETPNINFGGKSPATLLKEDLLRQVQLKLPGAEKLHGISELLRLSSDDDLKAFAARRGLTIKSKGTGTQRNVPKKTSPRKDIKDSHFLINNIAAARLHYGGNMVEEDGNIMVGQSIWIYWDWALNQEGARTRPLGYDPNDWYPGYIIGVLPNGNHVWVCLVDSDPAFFEIDLRIPNPDQPFIEKTGERDDESYHLDGTYWLFGTHNAYDFIDQPAYKPVEFFKATWNRRESDQTFISAFEASEYNTVWSDSNWIAWAPKGMLQPQRYYVHHSIEDIEHTTLESLRLVTSFVEVKQNLLKVCAEVYDSKQPLFKCFDGRREAKYDWAFSSVNTDFIPPDTAEIFEVEENRGIFTHDMFSVWQRMFETDHDPEDAQWRDLGFKTRPTATYREVDFWDFMSELSEHIKLNLRPYVDEKTGKVELPLYGVKRKATTAARRHTMLDKSDESEDDESEPSDDAPEDDGDEEEDEDDLVVDPVETDAHDHLLEFALRSTEQDHTWAFDKMDMLLHFFTEPMFEIEGHKYTFSAAASLINSISNPPPSEMRKKTWELLSKKLLAEVTQAYAITRALYNNAPIHTHLPVGYPSWKFGNLTINANDEIDVQASFSSLKREFFNMISPFYTRFMNNSSEDFDKILFPNEIKIPATLDPTDQNMQTKAANTFPIRQMLNGTAQFEIFKSVMAIKTIAENIKLIINRSDSAFEQRAALVWNETGPMNPKPPSTAALVAMLEQPRLTIDTKGREHVTPPLIPAANEIANPQAASGFLTWKELKDSEKRDLLEKGRLALEQAHPQYQIADYGGAALPRTPYGGAALPRTP